MMINHHHLLTYKEIKKFDTNLTQLLNEKGPILTTNLIRPIPNLTAHSFWAVIRWENRGNNSAHTQTQIQMELTNIDPEIRIFHDCNMHIKVGPIPPIVALETRDWVALSVLIVARDSKDTHSVLSFECRKFWKVGEKFSRNFELRASHETVTKLYSQLSTKYSLRLLLFSFARCILF